MRVSPSMSARTRASLLGAAAVSSMRPRLESWASESTSAVTRPALLPKW